MLKDNRNPNYECFVCNKPIYVRPNRIKLGGQFTCGGECAKVVRSERMKGSGNHQYGLKGKKMQVIKVMLKVFRGMYFVADLNTHLQIKTDL